MYLKETNYEKNDPKIEICCSQNSETKLISKWNTGFITGDTLSESIAFVTEFSSDGYNL